MCEYLLMVIHTCVFQTVHVEFNFTSALQTSHITIIHVYKEKNTIHFVAIMAYKPIVT